MKRIICFAVLVGTVNTNPVTAKDNAPAEPKSIQGTWKFTKFVVNGKERPEDFIKTLRMTIDDKKFELSGLPNKGKLTFTYKIKPDEKPSHVDLTATTGPHKDQENWGIYELEGDRLKICVPNEASKTRPEKFEAKEKSGFVLIELARKK